MNDAIAIIRREFRRSEEARYIHRLHAVLVVLLGKSTVEAGKLLGVPQRTVAHWVIAFRERGLDGLREEEKPGRPAVLSLRQQNALRAALKKAPTDVGLSGKRWTGVLVAEFLRKRHGIELTMRHCRRLLRLCERNLAETRGA